VTESILPASRTTEVRNRCAPARERLPEDAIHRLLVQDVAKLLADAHERRLGDARVEKRYGFREARGESAADEGALPQKVAARHRSIGDHRRKPYRFPRRLQGFGNLC
jgi:hypothetical protein